MIDIVQALHSLLNIEALLTIVVGCTIGTIIGILPGLGIVTTLAILLPYTSNLSPLLSIVMLASIYYGAQYGCSTTSILMNTPGEPSSIMTCVDGHKLTRNGEAGKAIMTAGVSSLIAGLLTVLTMAMVGPYISELSYSFGPREMSLLLIMGLLSISIIGSSNPINSIGMGLVGILLSTIGTDVNSGVIRFTADNPNLLDGLNIPILAVGLYGLAEVFNNVIFSSNKELDRVTNNKFLFSDFKRILPSSLRGTAIGSFLGLIPGGGAILSSFIAYAFEKKINKKANIGTGVIEGVAAPESANNAAAQMAFIPLMTLGIPDNAVMSLILANLILIGVQPGPGMMVKNPEIFWGLLASMIIGNILLVIFNVKFVNVWTKLLEIPKKYLYTVITIVCLYGAYYSNSSMFDVYLTLVFGVIGFILIRINLEPSSLIFGFLIGGMFEEYSRRALQISNGDYFYFMSNTISMIICGIILGLVGLLLFNTVRDYKSNNNKY